MKKLVAISLIVLVTPVCFAQTNQASQPVDTPSTETKQPPIIREVTPEQKVEFQKGIMRSIQANAVNSNPSERRRLMDAMETIKKIQIRQRNKNLPKDKQIVYEKPNVNVNNRREFQKYMQKTYLQDMDTSAEALAAKLPATEEKQEPTQDANASAPEKQ